MAWRRCWAQWGVHVLKARNSAEAALLCGRSGIDAVLADYHLGDGVDGIELLHRLRRSRLPALAAALISADHDADLGLAARNAGFPLLHKPLRPAALRALLCAFRRQARNYRGLRRGRNRALPVNYEVLIVDDHPLYRLALKAPSRPRARAASYLRRTVLRGCSTHSSSTRVWICCCWI